MHPILFKLGPITIYTYGFFVFLGVFAGYCVCLAEARRQAIEKRVFSDIFFWMIVISFVFARITYVLVEFESFLSDPAGVLFGRSGFVFYGGVAGAIIALHFLSKIHKIRSLLLLDIFALGVPLGHAFGRIGCFSFGCCYGRPTDSFIGVLFPAGSPAGAWATKLIPVQLFESALLAAIFLFLSYCNRRKRFTGETLLIYLFLYGIVRFVLEFYRGDPRGQVLNLSTSQIIALIAIAVSILLWKRWRR